MLRAKFKHININIILTFQDSSASLQNISEIVSYLIRLYGRAIWEFFMIIILLWNDILIDRCIIIQYKPIGFVSLLELEWK